MPDSQLARYFDGYFDCEIGQPLNSPAVPAPQHGFVFIEEWRFRIRMADCSSVLAAPVLIPTDFDIENPGGLPVHGANRDGQPFRSHRRLDLVPVAPPSPVILNVIQKDEYVRFLNLVEISTPRYVRWLQYDAFHKDSPGMRP